MVPVSFMIKVVFTTEKRDFHYHVCIFSATLTLLYKELLVVKYCQHLH